MEKPNLKYNKSNLNNITNQEGKLLLLINYKRKTNSLVVFGIPSKICSELMWTKDIYKQGK